MFLRLKTQAAIPVRQPFTASNRVTAGASQQWFKTKRYVAPGLLKLIEKLEKIVGDDVVSFSLGDTLYKDGQPDFQDLEIGYKSSMFEMDIDEAHEFKDLLEALDLYAEDAVISFQAQSGNLLIVLALSNDRPHGANTIYTSDPRK